MEGEGEKYRIFIRPEVGYVKVMFLYFTGRLKNAKRSVALTSTLGFSYFNY